MLKCKVYTSVYTYAKNPVAIFVSPPLFTPFFVDAQTTFLRSLLNHGQGMNYVLPRPASLFLLVATDAHNLALCDDDGSVFTCVRVFVDDACERVSQWQTRHLQDETGEYS